MSDAGQARLRLATLTASFQGGDSDVRHGRTSYHSGAE